MTTITEDDVDQYLREHPQFLATWLLENADDDTLRVVARKFKQDALSQFTHQNGQAGKSMPAVEEKESTGSLSEDSMTIEQNEDRNLQTYRTFSKVGRNSITSMIFRKYLDGDRTRRSSVKKDLDDLKRMSEEELFMELIRDIASELDVNVLCHKILQNVSILTNSDRGSLFLVRGSRDNKYLVSKLFDVTESSTLEQSIHTEANEIIVPFGVGIAGNVALSREPINIKDVYADPRFNQEVDKKTGYRTHSILSMPIVNFEGEVIGVAQIINKISGNHEFSKQDEDLFRKYLTFCGIGITNAQLFEMSVNEFKRNQLLLHLARGMFEEQSNLEKLVQKIMLDAQDLLKCERCSVYLLDDSFQRDIMSYTSRFLNRLSSYSRTGNLVVAMQDPSNQFRQACKGDNTSEPLRKVEDVHFSQAFELYAGKMKVLTPAEFENSKAAFIAKITLVAGETLNIEDLTRYGGFVGHHVPEDNGFSAKSVLCMPIHNSDRTIIGVTQLINKVNGQPFDENDEHIIEAFSIFTGLGIHNCQMYENACQLMAKQSVALEVLSYHATASKEEAERIMVERIPASEDYKLYRYDFDDKLMSDDDTIKATIRMFLDANLISQFKVPYETMCRWVCTVKKNYRPVTYHNWRHAFNVCQTMFTMLYTGDLRPKFDAVEVFALMAACLCHDLDHRGTNNAFQVKVASPLAMLYSTSVLEHHHFDHCIMIINSEGNNIFQSFPPEEYRRAIKILEHAILSTDLALYFKKRGDFKALVENGEREFLEENKKDLLKAMMMTACDVAAITKPWKIQKEIAQLVTAEFFEQGDIEKTQLGEKPIPMMDREKKDELPKMQVDFIDFICAPVYELFAKVSESLKPLNDGCQANRQHWKNMSNTMQLKTDVQKENAHSGEKPKEDEARSEPPQQNCETYKTQPEPQDTALTSKHDQKTKEHVNAHSVGNDFKATIYSNAHVVPNIQADVKSESKYKKTSKHVETRKSSKSSKSHFCSIS
ncbi:cGMP-specific 3 5-cyclic phosphodiesterase isoform X3 [Biomphalaria pfeifferi]|uniref:Phosphodiesterase n=1 Tax=Biomphalaria pfeifferi TaxID=112525 RepID=A0AAD8EVE0_BIOPF|nr:cGMP-specific 3 5-cyclic phosphodiesterase isoform X3 [Biomphalaria pfeifferi]